MANLRSKPSSRSFMLVIDPSGASAFEALQSRTNQMPRLRSICGGDGRILQCTIQLRKVVDAPEMPIERNAAMRYRPADNHAPLLAAHRGGSVSCRFALEPRENRDEDAPTHLRRQGQDPL